MNNIIYILISILIMYTLFLYFPNIIIISVHSYLNVYIFLQIPQKLTLYYIRNINYNTHDKRRTILCFSLYPLLESVHSLRSPSSLWTCTQNADEYRSRHFHTKFDAAQFSRQPNHLLPLQYSIL